MATGKIIKIGGHSEGDDLIREGYDASGNLGAGDVQIAEDLAVSTNKKFYLDGGTNTYLIYNGTKVELYVGGVKKASWG